MRQSSGRTQIGDVGRELIPNDRVCVRAYLLELATTGASEDLVSGDLDIVLLPITWLMKRMQRVQWMQRVMTVLTRGPRYLSSTALLNSVYRPCLKP